MWYIHPLYSLTLTALTYLGVLLAFALLPFSPLLALIVFLATMCIGKDNDAEAAELVVAGVIWIIVLYALFCAGEWVFTAFTGVRVSL